MKVVFHVDELGKWKEARGNIKNLLKLDDSVKVVLLVNGEAIRGYTLKEEKKFIEAHPKVHFHACNNAMKAFDVKKEEIPENVEVVPAGVMDLIKLQNDGYAYIKP